MIENAWPNQSLVQSHHCQADKAALHWIVDSGEDRRIHRSLFDLLAREDGQGAVVIDPDSESLVAAVELPRRKHHAYSPIPHNRGNDFFIHGGTASRAAIDA